MSWLKDNNICVTSVLTVTDLIFGKFEMEDFLLINHILLIGQYYLIRGNIMEVFLRLAILLPGQGVFIAMSYIL